MAHVDFSRGRRALRAAMVKGYAPLAAHNKPHLVQGTCA
jgi:hypothetical protein